jgi:hypothetical protein
MKNELSSVEKEEGHCIAVEIFPHFSFPFSLSLTFSTHCFISYVVQIESPGSHRKANSLYRSDLNGRLILALNVPLGWKMCFQAGKCAFRLETCSQAGKCAFRLENVLSGW